MGEIIAHALTVASVGVILKIGQRDALAGSGKTGSQDQG